MQATNAATPKYDIVGVGIPLGTSSAAGRMNSLGQIVMSSGSHSFIYQNGQVTDLGAFSAYDINDFGTIVGLMNPPDGSNSVGVIYQNGQITPLVAAPGLGSQARSINNAGQITGDAAFPGNVQTHAFLYENGQMTDIGTLADGDLSQAISINELGHVVGFSATSVSEGDHAFIFRNGKMEDLGTLGGPTSIAYGINEHDHVVGQADLAQGAGLHGVLFRDGQAIDLGSLGGLSVAYGINDSDQIVGVSQLPGQRGPLHAFLWERGTMYDLNDLIPADSGWILPAAGSISNAGWITGYGRNPQGREEGFLLIPVPEPTAIGWFIGLLLATCQRIRGPDRWSRHAGPRSPCPEADYAIS